MINLPFFPPEASTVAGQVDLLLLVLLALGLFFTAIVMSLIVYFGLKYRRGRQADRSNPPTGNTRMEVGWMLGLLVLSMGTFTWATKIYFDMNRPPQNALEVYVIGKQWMWKFQHAEGPREIDELHVPLGRPIRLIMTSQDVIHSLYVPAFRLKYDVIPGRYTSLWFQATQAGEYHLLCAEYCGANHSQMGGSIIVMEPRDYQNWLSTGSSGELAGGSLETAGAQLFQQFGCSGCHTSPAAGRAPSLVGIFGQQVQLSNGETVTVDENYIRESILFPERKVVAGYDPIMPTFQGSIDEEQLVDIVAYVKSLSGGEP